MEHQKSTEAKKTTVTQTPTSIEQARQNQPGHPVLQLQQLVGNRQVTRMIANGAIQMARGGAEADAPASEQTPIDITGHYEAIDPDGNNRITLQINQAGHHFEGWWQRRLLSHGRQRLESRRLSGGLQSSDRTSITFTYRRFTEGSSAGANGTLSANPSGQITMMDSNGWMQGFRRLSTTPRLSNEAIAAAPAETRELVRATETAPLDSQEERRLAQGSNGIRTLVEEYFNSSHGITRAGKAAQLNGYLERLVSPHATEQMILVVRRLREQLTGPTYRVGSTTRPYWDWMQIIVTAHPTYTQNLQQRLGMRTDGSAGPDSPQHRYRWRFSTVGLAGDVGVGLGGFLGVFIVEKLSPDSWQQRYFTLMGGVSGGLSAGVTVGQTTDWSEFQTPFAWGSGNFRGAYVIAGTAAGGAAVAGPSGGASFITFYGDGSFPPLAGDASGFAALYGLYIGAEFSMTTGRLWGGREEAIRNAPQQRAVTTDSQYGAGTTTHFNVDDPSLTTEGRQLIRVMAATHRAAFSNSNSALSIDGYTSTTGSEARNLTLSNLRAQNTAQAIRDCLGPAFRIPSRNVHVVGHGEEAARRAGVADNVEDLAWRKVEVRLNGQVVLTLR
jgi:outer membrane protein OmpA-like peptidoglycan-associated protein